MFPRALIALVFLVFSAKAVQAVWEPCNGVTGTCIDVRAHTCSTTTLTGRCPGPSYNRCCQAPAGVSSSGCTAKSGLCMRTSTCSTGSVLTGLCPGPSGITCCATPASSGPFATKLVQVTKSEYATYGGRHECNSASMKNRIKTYWGALNLNLDGCNRDVPWSAAFISYMVRSADAGNRFRYSSAHRVYIHDAFAGARALYNSAVNIQTSSIKTGDLVCSGRGSISTWTFTNFRNWYNSGGISYRSIPTHCDIVTAVSGSSFTVIGGNVNQRVTKKTTGKSSYAVLLPVSG